jgi:exodeoxyribonuclease V alpha subunit
MSGRPARNAPHARPERAHPEDGGPAGADARPRLPGLPDGPELPDGREELRGEIERVVYHNPQNGFCVLRIKVRGKSERGMATLVGALVDPAPGLAVTARGKWVQDPKWGPQFKADDCGYAPPATIDGIRNFLESSLTKGIGKLYAGRIVDLFGEDTIRVLDEDPERLLAVPGIGRKRLKQITESWRETSEIREAMLFLQSYDIGAGYAVRIVSHYGRDAVRKVTENPYRLAMDVHGFGFLTADAIAMKLGFSRDSDLRAEAGIIYALRQSSDQGNVYVPLPELVAAAQEILGLEREQVEAAVRSVAERRWAVIEELNYGLGTAVYLAGLHAAEKYVAARLGALLSMAASTGRIDVPAAVKSVYESTGIRLSERQQAAVAAAARSKVLVITGGPGTGKTTIINAILRIFEQKKARILLAAPTGRAAKRMAEATGHEAKTLHRLLEFSPTEGGFKRGENSALNCDLLVVDEASMIDVTLMQHLLRAVPLGATLLLVGDVNQLPSVGPGNVLGDCIASRAVPVVRLTEIFRQAQESAIIMNAHAINEGRVPYIEHNPDGPLTDFYFVRREDPDDVLAMILELVARRIPARFGLDPMNDVQVLTPMHKGVVGAQNLNVQLQAALNPAGRAIQRGARAWRVGDKVMQIRNNYDKDVFNGDIGRIADADEKAGELLVRFDERDVPYESHELDELTPAYAVSIHKSQGSEYPAVVVPVLTQHFIMLQRNLIYTAVTRGKRLVVLVGTKKALSIAVRNQAVKKRYTYLAERLAEMGEALGVREGADEDGDGEGEAEA